MTRKYEKRPYPKVEKRAKPGDIVLESTALVTEDHGSDVTFQNPPFLPQDLIPHASHDDAPSDGEAIVEARLRSIREKIGSFALLLSSGVVGTGLTIAAAHPEWKIDISSGSGVAMGALAGGAIMWSIGRTIQEHKANSTPSLQQDEEQDYR